MKGLIFDCDDTILNIKEYIPVYIQILREAYHSCTGDTMRVTNGECYKAMQLPVLESCKMLRNEWGVEPEKFWRAVFNLDRSIRNRELGSKVKPFRDAYMVRRLAKRYMLGVLSNTPEPIVEYQLRYFKLRSLFQAVVCGFYKSDMCKPETQGLKLCLEKMGLEPGEAAIIGDSDIDVAVGKKMGLLTIQVDRGHWDYGNPKADHVIKSLRELEGILK
ncbi:MAG: HAD family hydrolase [Candidatus Aenigmatarchaeota archaeon]